MLRNFFKTIGGIGIYILALCVPFMGIMYWSYSNLSAAHTKGSQEKILFQVKDQTPIDEIAKQLVEKGILKSARSFSFITNFRMSPEEKAALKITAGEYSLSPGLKPKEILNKLVAGEVVTYDMTIPPGSSMTQVAEQIAASGILPADQMLETMKNSSLMASLGIPAYIPEGFLVEGTYSFTRMGKAEDIVTKLISEAEKKLLEGIPDWKEKGQSIGFQPYDILKLASLIEKQASDPGERRKISSLLHNRIRIGMPLQSDLALSYALQKDPAELTEEDRKEAGPYNTFVNTGLPLTPICSPSFDSINAALEPEDTDFLYLAPKGDGTHDFSSSFKEHLKKQKQYRDAVLGLAELQ